MRQHDIENHLKVVLNDFKGQVIDESTIDGICNRLEQESQHEFAYIIWSTKDIEEIRPDWDENKVNIVADSVGDVLHDRSIEEGWEILNYLVSQFDGDDEE